MSCAEVHLSRDQVRSASGQPIPMSVADPICPEGADGILSYFALDAAQLLRD